MAFEILGNIVSIASTVYDHAELVKANKVRCQRLSDRVRIIVDALQGLDTLSDSRQFKKALEDLLTLIQEIDVFILKFSRGRWFKRVAKAKSYQSEFEDFNESLKRSIILLNLGLNAQQVMNREQDQDDLAADVESIQKDLDEIIRLNREEYKKMALFRSDQSDQHEIIVRMLDSLKIEISQMQLSSSETKYLLPEHFTIPHHELDFSRLVHEGESTKVYRGRWHEEKVAIKLFQGIFTEAQQKLFVHEIQTMSQIHNRSVVQFYGACLEEGRACIVMEPMSNGSLFEAFGQEELRQELKNPVLQRRMAIEIGRGLAYLHRKGILHCNLNSRHILLNSELHAKITDLCVAKVLVARPGMETVSPYRAQRVEIIAPELLRRGIVPTRKSDIFNYGIVLWELFSGQSIDEEILGKIRAGDTQEIIDQVPRAYREIIVGCWELNPNMRFKLSSIVTKLKMIRIRAASPGPEELYQQGSACLQNRDYEGARGFFSRAANKGHTSARTTLGILYLQGLGGSTDKTRAYELLLESAKEGHGRAQYNIGQMLEYGDGVPENTEEAFIWYQKAATQEYVKAQYRMGQMLEHGIGVEEDIEQALIWYQKVAEQNQDSETKEKALKKIQILETRQNPSYVLNSGV